MNVGEAELKARLARAADEIGVVMGDEDFDSGRLEIVLKILLIPAGITDVDDIGVALSMLESATKGLRHDELLQFKEPGAAEKMQTMKEMTRVLREEMRETRH